ncbi:creatininase family protein [Paenibacillus koleovorans]|uniref:creatininase family protein n=1 Tax=Paenibacillus koleovorans TaxID=121608 RepID=UPI0013E2DECD|nr:creatininase family protein [Paenibacillus koleovorans]
MLTMFNNKRDFEAAATQTAIFPVGAVEQHGSHLPVGTDTIIVSEFAKRMGEALDAYVLPPLAVTSSIEHRESRGTVYLKADTLALVIRDICESLHYSGFTKIIVLNGHGGNWIIKPTIRQLIRDFADRKQPIEIVLIHTSVVAKRQHEVAERTLNDIHAGEKETSLMMHLTPEHVKPHVPQTQAVSVPQDYMDYFDMDDISEDGYWGYPELASREKGEKLMQLLVECGLDYLRELDETREAVRQSKQCGAIKQG